jgi:carbonic anhydrase/acetyltransferase-like protein (isoleucine patch superfamily)
VRQDVGVLIGRSGVAPSVAATARIAPSAQLVGDVQIGDGGVVDYGAALVNSGPPVVIGAGSVVRPNAVIRSSGGAPAGVRSEHR